MPPVRVSRSRVFRRLGGQASGDPLYFPVFLYMFLHGAVPDLKVRGNLFGRALFPKGVKGFRCCWSRVKGFVPRYRLRW